jgi:hypothetical protein
VAKVLTDYGILLFPLKISKEEKKRKKEKKEKLDCLLLDFNRVGCLIFTTMCRENG